MEENLRYIYSHDMTVRWGDMDAFGHVNNSVYLTYFEQVRIEWLRSIDMLSIEKEGGPIMVTADCTYLKPLLEPAVLNLKLYVGNPGRSSFMTFHEIYVDDVKCAQGHVKLVWFDYNNEKSIPIPDKLRQLIT